MRAGLLKHMLVFEAPVEHQTETGAVEKAYEKVFQCRAWRKKQALLSADTVASEPFISQTVVMQVRKYPEITYGCRVRYAGSAWEIRMIEPDGNELVLTLKRIDL